MKVSENIPLRNPRSEATEAEGRSKRQKAAKNSSRREEEFRILGVTFPVRRYADGRFVSWYYEGSKQRPFTAQTREALYEKAKVAAVNVVNGRQDVNELGNGEARAAIAAQAAIAHLKMPLDAAAREYAAARALLGETDLLEAVRFYKRHAGQSVREKKVAPAIAEFLVAKSGLSESYREQMEKDLGRFEKTFGERLVSEVASAELSEWLSASGRIAKSGPREGQRIRPSGSRINQIRNTVVTLFNFCRDQGYLLRERRTEAELLAKAKHVRSEIVILSPADFRMLLELTAQFDRQWLPMMVLGGFCGIRSKTLPRVDWRMIRWGQSSAPKIAGARAEETAGHVVVPAAKGKVGRRHLVPFPSAAAAWLADWRDMAGPVISDQEPRYFLNRLARRAGWPKWIKNVLRKSFISYRMAIVKSAAAVALEANTSAKEIEENYREVCHRAGELVTEEVAAEYFSIAPEERANVIPIQGHLAL